MSARRFEVSILFLAFAKSGKKIDRTLKPSTLLILGSFDILSHFLVKNYDLIIKKLQISSYFYTHHYCSDNIMLMERASKHSAFCRAIYSKLKCWRKKLSWIMFISNAWMLLKINLHTKLTLISVHLPDSLREYSFSMPIHWLCEPFL